MNNQDFLIRPAALMKIIGVSRSTLWRLEKAGKLPQKIIISDRVCGWLESDIEQWLGELKRTRSNEHFDWSERQKKTEVSYD